MACLWLYHTASPKEFSRFLEADFDQDLAEITFKLSHLMHYSFLALQEYKTLAVNATEADLWLLKLTRNTGHVVLKPILGPV